MTAAALPPGPRLPGLAQAVLWGLRYPQFTASARARFGPTYTIHPGTMDPLVVTTDHEAIANLFTGDPLGKAHGNDAVRPMIDDGSVLLMSGREHLARRKLLLPPFHGDRVRGYAALMRELMEAEVDGWQPGQTVAVLPVAQNVTIEVILQAVLGVADKELRRRFRRLIDDTLFYPLGALRLRLSGAIAPRVRAPRRMREVAAFAGSLPTPAVMTYFPGMKERSPRNLMTRRWWQLHDGLLDLLDEQIAATRDDARLADREDILAMLVRARDEDGAAIPDADLREELLTLISAGHETTAAAIAWGAVLLAHHPDVRERAERAVAEDDDRYLGALVKEILRLRPPLPVGAGRTLEQHFTIGDRTLPAGTLVLIDAWGVHHDPDRHPDPEVFRPERFLGENAESYSWLPFGGGARRCIGASLAQLEIDVAMRALLRRWTLEPADHDFPPTARRGVVMVPHGGGRVRIR